jgi:hypothetical protein
MTNYELIACFEPSAKFLGLDALFMIAPCLCGDVNNDGKVTMADVMILWYDIADYPSAGAWEIACCE